LVPEFSSCPERTKVELAIDHDTTTDTSAEGHAEHDRGAATCSDRAFGQCESSSIVDHRELTTEAITNAIPEGVLSPWSGEIRKQFDTPAFTVKETRHTEADAGDQLDTVLCVEPSSDQAFCDRIGTIFSMCCRTRAVNDRGRFSRRVNLDNGRLDVRATEIDSEMPCRVHSESPASGG
jgi:hypothetical protein